jgi:transposase-like protein
MKPSTCPVCGSERLIIVLREDRKGVCCDCGSQWLETILGERMVVAVPKRSSEAEPR